MKKKIIVLVSVAVLTLVAGGVFYWWQKREIKGSPKDYVIKETPEGKIVENKKAGLKVRAPEKWEAEKMEVDEGLAIFYPSETEMELREGKIVLPIKKGCFIRTTVIYKKGDFEAIKRETKLDHLLIGRVNYDEFEEITINNYRGLKNSFELVAWGFEKLESGISIYIPLRNKVYGFHLTWGPEDKERCVQEFNKFLETVSIK